MKFLLMSAPSGPDGNVHGATPIKSASVSVLDLKESVDSLQIPLNQTFTHVANLNFIASMC